MNSKRIYSLEVLRAFAFMMIMIYHATMDKFGKLGGEWAVSLFFVLSGFVSVISQNN